MKEITIDGITYECTPKEVNHSLVMEHKSSGLIVEFTGLRKGTVLSNNNGKIEGWSIGEYDDDFYNHTSNMWKPYNPVCDHKLDGYYVKASIEALCTLKILGYKVHTKEVPDYEYFGIVNGEIQGHDGTNIGLPMTFKDGQFIVEPENPKFEEGDYIKANNLVGQIIRVEEQQYKVNWGNGKSSWKSEEFLELWTIKNADPESYVFCWADGDDSRNLEKASILKNIPWDNYAPDINNEAERLGLK